MPSLGDGPQVFRVSSIKWTSSFKNTEKDKDLNIDTFA